MVRVIHINAEQNAHYEVMKAYVKMVYADDARRWEPAIMAQGKALLDRAVELEMDSTFFVEIQLILANYQRERDGPEGIRDKRFKPGWDG